MALTLGDFIGFETGGLQEVSRGTSGSPTAVGSGTVTQRTGTYCLELQDSDYVDLLPSADAATAGNDFIIGFAIRFETVSPSASSRFFSAAAWDTGSVLRLNLETDNKIGLYDEGDSKIGTSSSAVSADTWYYFELIWQHSAIGSADLYIDDTSEISVSSQDFDNASTFDESNGNYRFRGPIGEGITVYFDDVYTYSGASGTSDRLGSGAEVLGAYQNTAEDATDQGDTLGDGTWADAGDTPGVDETIGLAAGYTDAGAVQGYTICDEGTRSGPSGDSVGTVKGGKWLHRLMRGGGGPNDHYKVYGHNGDTQADVVVLGTVWENFFTILDVSDSKVPSSSEYFAQGGGKAAGGREWYAADLWSFLLHVAGGQTISFSATMTGASTTPDNANLVQVARFVAAMTGASTTPDTVTLAVLRALSATMTGASTTPDDADLLKVVGFLATMTGASTTPDDAALVQARAFSAIMTGASTTPDDVVLAVQRALSAVMTGASTTPDTVTLAILRALSAMMTGASTTPDDVVLAVLRAMSATMTGASTTPDDTVLAVLRAMIAVMTGASTTPDDAVLSLAGIISFAATMTGASSTPDDTVLAVLRAMIAVMTGASTTPDDAVLSLAGLVAFAATMTGASSTPDDTVLAVQRAFAAVMTGASTTPDDTVLAVQRAFAAVMTGASSTPDDTVLAVLRAFAATMTGASSTPDDTALAVQRAFSATMAGASSTPDDAALVQVARFMATMTGASTTPDDAVLTAAAIVGLMIVALSGRAPGVATDGRAPGMAMSGRKPDVTMSGEG